MTVSDLALDRDELVAMFEGCTEPVVVLDASTLATAALNPAARELVGDAMGDLARRLVERASDRFEWAPDATRRVDVRVLVLPSKIVAYLTDTTERRAERAEREHLERQLRRTQRMEPIARLAGGIAHDFNNMLSVILNYADFARRRVADDARTVEYVDAIRKAALRSSALTRQLLIFGKRDLVEPEILDVDAVVREVATLLRRTIGEDVDLVLDLAGDLPPVLLAWSHAEQVLMNLTVNARDAMPHGGRLTVRTSRARLDDREALRAGLPAGEYVALSVIDTGTGMTPDVLASAFEPFFTTKEAGQGTGLGLSIVYGIVEGAGGDVTVESEPGRGSTFRVLLPVTSGQPKPAAVEPAGPMGHGERVIVIEDEPSVRDLAAHILEHGGYDVRAAADPAEAVAWCRERPVDLVLSDVVMPGLSGAELAAAVEAARPGTPVLFMSGHADERLRRHRPGAIVAFLQKPFTGDELLRAVRAALDSRPATRTPSS